MANRVWKWEFRRDMSVLVNYCFGVNYLKFIKHFAYLSENGTQDLYWDAKEAKIASENLVGGIMKGPRFFPRHVVELEKHSQNLALFAAKLNRSFSKASDSDLLRLYRGYAKRFESAAYYVLWIRVLIDQGPVKLEEQVARHSNIPADAMLALTATPHRSFMVDEDESLLTIAKKIRGDPKALALFSKNSEAVLAGLAGFSEIHAAVQAHWRFFQWIPCGYADETPLTDADVVNALRKAVVQDVDGRLKALNAHEGLIVVEKKRVLVNLQLETNWERLAEALSDCVYYKDFIRGVMNKAQFDSRPLFAEIARRMNATFGQVKSLTPLEFEAAWNRQSNATLKKIVVKRKRYVAFLKGGHLVFSEGAEAQKIRQDILKAVQNKSSNSVQGVAACAGVVSGPVRVVRNPSLVHRHDSGFVLVVSMTTPEFIPIMKRALAVVTDEGGITCHAAIVARELGVPCVVGTKFATKVFKDGDVVRVDAASGRVAKT